MFLGTNSITNYTLAMKNHVFHISIITHATCRDIRRFINDVNKNTM